MSNNNSEVSKKKRRTATTPETRENQMIALAVDLAEKQLEKGTASSQVISHYLKLGSTNNRIERRILQEKAELLKAKTDAIQSAKKIEELYKHALDAMKSYSGGSVDEDEDD